MSGLGAITDDRETARGAAQQQHLPFRVGEFLGLVHDDVGERACQHVGLGTRQPGVILERHLHVGTPQHRHDEHLGVVRGDQVLDDPVHLLALICEDQFPMATPSRGIGVA